MKTSRFLIAAGFGIAIIAVVWQARTIGGLRGEMDVLRRDLRTVLAGTLEQAPSASPAEQAQRDRLELIKLRHEARELRENLVEARASQPGGLKGLLSPLLPKAGRPMQLRPEWKGMEQHATNVYAGAMRGVNNGTNELVRFLSLHTAAKMSLAVGRTEEARRLAEDLMTLDDKYSRGDPEKASGEAVHDGNVVLGRIAVEEGRMEDAKKHLLAAGRSNGSPVLSTFGPNMGLAKALLEKGEQATVLEYFVLCRKFWGSQSEKLDLWRKDVEAGRIPEFGANLNY